MSLPTSENIAAAVESVIIGRNAERNRRIVYRRMADGIGLERLAGEFELSVSTIKRVVKQCRPIIEQKMNQ